MIDDTLIAHVPEMRQLNAALRDAAAGVTLSADPGFLALARSVPQAAIPGGDPAVSAPSPLAEQIIIPGPAGDLPVRIIRPPTVRAVYLSIHGGGFFTGSAADTDGLHEQIALRAQVAVVSPDYRLAPEHPYPAAVEDCAAVASWLVEHGAAEFGTRALIVGGESAGAYLAVTTLLAMRDRIGGIDRVCGANLCYGVYDLSGVPSQRLAGDNPPMINSRNADTMCEWFTPGLDTERRRAPEVSPLWSDLRRLVPALFTVGTADPLLDHTLFMASRWQASGNPAELLVYPEGPHGVNFMPTAMGRIAAERIERFIISAAALDPVR